MDRKKYLMNINTKLLVMPFLVKVSQMIGTAGTYLFIKLMTYDWNLFEIDRYYEVEGYVQKNDECMITCSDNLDPADATEIDVVEPLEEDGDV